MRPVPGGTVAHRLVPNPEGVRTASPGRIRSGAPRVGGWERLKILWIFLVESCLLGQLVGRVGVYPTLDRKRSGRVFPDRERDSDVLFRFLKGLCRISPRLKGCDPFGSQRVVRGLYPLMPSSLFSGFGLGCDVSPLCPTGDPFLSCRTAGTNRFTY